MPETIPHQARRSRHLAVVPPSAGASVITPRRPAPSLSRAAALRLDQAELFLLSLDGEMLTADAPRAAYLLGVAELHLAGLIEILRAVAP